MTQKTFIIAEAGVNHNGEMDKAIALIDLAADAGADAVKFQTFKTEKLTTKRAATCDYQKAAMDGAQSQQDMLRALELSESQFCELAAYCQKRGIEFMSTGFDTDSLDFLTQNTPMKWVKIPSGELVNPFLLLHAARTGLPVIVSTGLASLDEVRLSLGVLAFGFLNKVGVPTKAEALELMSSGQGKAVLKDMVTVLHCTSEYPAPYAGINLRAMQTLADEFGLPIGLSDHSEGTAVPVAAVALGAEVIEKHFTLDKTLAGPDHKASLSPEELKDLVSSIRAVEQALGTGEKRPSSVELGNKMAVRGSLVASREIVEDESFSMGNVTVKRPGDGLHPMSFLDLNGQKAVRGYQIDDQIDE